jgi:lysozyme
MVNKMQARNPDNPQGIDVSQHQGDINWSQVVESEKSFVFIKATEGATVTDTKFDFNYREAKNAGLYVGAYHFAYPESNDDAILEADYFIDTVINAGGFKGNLPPVLDLESNPGRLNKEGLSEWARIWMEHVWEKTGIQPIIYTYLDFGQRSFNDSLGEYPLWFARYGVQEPEDCAGWSSWAFLQYANDGVVPGIYGKVDLNEFDGSMEELEVLITGNISG